LLLQSIAAKQCCKAVLQSSAAKQCCKECLRRTTACCFGLAAFLWHDLWWLTKYAPFDLFAAPSTVGVKKPSIASAAAMLLVCHNSNKNAEFT
jgi:hypothetical protein